MKQIVVEVKDQEKAKMLLELLAALDFVDSVKTKDIEDREAQSSGESLDFFSMAGLWQNRDINLATIRQQAWPRQS